MNNLKSAIGKDKGAPVRHTPHKDESLLKGVNRSKGAQLWSLEDDDDPVPTRQDILEDPELSSIRQKLLALNREYGLEVSELVVQRGVAECAEDMSWSKGELSRLLVLSDKVGSLLELNPQGDFKTFLLKFLSVSLATLQSMRSQEKREELNHYNELATLTFTKKNHYRHSINEDAPLRRKEKTQQSSMSCDKHRSQQKLGRLFSKDKPALKEVSKEISGKAQQQPASNNQLRNSYKDVTFSAAINSSVGVRMRRSRPIQKQPQKVMGEPEDKGEQEENAFMFFRPKKPRQAGK